MCYHIFIIFKNTEKNDLTWQMINRKPNISLNFLNQYLECKGQESQAYTTYVY